MKNKVKPTKLWAAVTESGRITRADPDRSYIAQALTEGERAVRIVAAAVPEAEAKNERCPTCGKPVTSIFDHVDHEGPECTPPGITMHTPGPLIAHHQPAYSQSSDGLDDSIMREDGTVVALIHLIAGTRQDVVLWAAATDLLATLQRMSRDIHDQEETGLCKRMRINQIADIDAAIAKATTPSPAPGEGEKL